MSKLTDILKLFCYDPETDGASTFNIEQALNDNWNKIDQFAKEQQNLSNHITDKNNPHGVTAAQIGAIPAAQKGAAGGVASLGSDGKVLSGQLPEMNYDPEGSAEAVQTDLTNHINNKQNPHGVTAEQIGAVKKTGDTMTGALGAPAFNVVSGNRVSAYFIDTYNNVLLNNYLDPSNFTQLSLLNENNLLENILTLHVGKNGVLNSYNVLHTGNLSLLGVPKIATGSYVGTGTYGINSPTKITAPFAPKIMFMFGRWAVFSYGSGNGSMDAVAIAVPSTNKVYVTVDSRNGSIPLSVNGNTISFYSSDSHEGQGNYNGSTYHWVAMG